MRDAAVEDQQGDWSNFAEADDYSFDPTKLSFADATRVTVYQNGTLIWRTEPPAAAGALELDQLGAGSPHEAGASSGGCSAAGGSPLGLAIALGGLLLGRRRPRADR